jgi:hypothetical protein
MIYSRFARTGESDEILLMYSIRQPLKRKPYTETLNTAIKEDSDTTKKPEIKKS